MSKHFTAGLVGIALTASIFAGPAAAQRTCPAGTERTAGTCTTAGLAYSMTKRSVLINNMKINGFTLPVTPQQDRASPYPADAAGFEHGQFGNFSTNPNPRSP